MSQVKTLDAVKNRWEGIVSPINDIYPHNIESLDCACGPTIIDGILLHSAFDAREYLEPDNPKYDPEIKGILTIIDDQIWTRSR